MAVSICDVAKEARGSPSTVSRALQDHPRFGAETKKRIQAVDGIVVLASHLFYHYLQFFEPSRVPIVFINEQKQRKTMHFVTIDDVHGAQLAVEHLLALGHRRIGYIDHYSSASV